MTVGLQLDSELTVAGVLGPWTSSWDNESMTAYERARPAAGLTAGDWAAARLGADCCGWAWPTNLRRDNESLAIVGRALPAV